MDTARTSNARYELSMVLEHPVDQCFCTALAVFILGKVKGKSEGNLREKVTFGRSPGLPFCFRHLLPSLGTGCYTF